MVERFATAIAFAQAAGAHPAIAAFVADICADGAPAAVVDEAVNRWGRVDVLVKNAGAAAMIPLAETTGARIAELFALKRRCPGSHGE